MFAYMNECKKAFVFSNKLVLLKSGTMKKWKMYLNNSINDTYKVYKDLRSQEWLKINCYLQVGTWLIVLANLKSKLPKLKLLVWLTQQMGEEATVLLTSHKNSVRQEKTWIKNHKNQKFLVQNQIYVNLKLKTHVKYWWQEDINKRN